jgi:alpha-aminoadipate carrier protein LysW
MDEFPPIEFDPDETAIEFCPACGDRVRLDDDVVLGEILWCDNCGAELEVVSVEPMRIELFEEEEK